MLTVNCRTYLVARKAGVVFVLSWTPASLMFGRHVDAALSTMKKAFSDFEVIRVSRFPELHLARLSTSGCNRGPMLLSLLRPLQTSAKSSAYAETSVVSSNRPLLNKVIPNLYRFISMFLVRVACCPNLEIVLHLTALSYIRMYNEVVHSLCIA